jgi:hypothetical protein
MKSIQVLAAFVLVAALFLSSCSRKDSTREIADKFIAAENAAWATGNLADLEALEDPAVVYHMPGLEMKGWKAHADYITQGRPRVSNLKQSWKYLSGEGTALRPRIRIERNLQSRRQEPRNVDVEQLLVCCAAR